ncbi:MAG: hypothetical protein ACRD7E_09060, partial [Bryobacteraceae bacterium]
GKQEDINNDEGIAIWLQSTPYEEMRNYFRYEGNIERNYYRALHELRDAQAGRRTRERRDGVEPVPAEAAAEPVKDMMLPEEAIAALTKQHVETRLALAAKRSKPAEKPKDPAPGQVSDSGNGFDRQLPLIFSQEPPQDQQPGTLK